ncbi:MAG: hypothetical protein WCD35_11595 [Mycobacteriales bacterium]
MSEMTSGLRALEMDERQATLRARARRELDGVVLDSTRRRLFRSRTARRAA